VRISSFFARAYFVESADNDSGQAYIVPRRVRFRRKSHGSFHDREDFSAYSMKILRDHENSRGHADITRPNGNGRPASVPGATRHPEFDADRG
jgi:hypothetical protein